MAADGRQASHESLAITLDTMREGFQIISTDWRYLYVNATAARHGKTTPEALLGRTMSDCYPGIEDTPLFELLRDCMSQRTPASMDNEFRYPDGTTGMFELRIQPCPEGLLVLSMDVTEHRSFERRRRQSQKMEALGKLAGGIAHDFNNMLTAILSFGEFALESLPDDPSSAASDLDELLGAARRAEGLTKQLLAFARAEAVEPKSVSLNEQLLAADKLLRRLLGADVDVVSVPRPDLWTTFIDPGGLQQVLLNLAVNARDAMPDGGCLTLETSNVSLDKAYVLKRGVEVPPGDYVTLAVTDTGVGMSRRVQERLFEPFFTTKERGDGTGFGLATSYGIISQAGGFISVYSEPGEGSTFKVYLPRYVRPGETVMTDVRPRPRGGTETVLVVEDDERLRVIAERTLKRGGYHVITARNGREAFARSEEHDAPLHLLLCDLVLPHMSGPNVAERLLEERPGLRVLFMSGYAEGAALRQFPTSHPRRMLGKPFTPDSLLAKVRDTLDES